MLAVRCAFLSLIHPFVRPLILPCRVIHVPLSSRRLASTAMDALQVDAELSPLVRRNFSLVAGDKEHDETILRTEYSATTNRMLRVAVNGFMESLGVVLQVMEELDVDVVQSKS